MLKNVTTLDSISQSCTLSVDIDAYWSDARLANKLAAGHLLTPEQQACLHVPQVWSAKRLNRSTRAHALRQAVVWMPKFEVVMGLGRIHTLPQCATAHPLGSDSLTCYKRRRGRTLHARS